MTMTARQKRWTLGGIVTASAAAVTLATTLLIQPVAAREVGPVKAEVAGLKSAVCAITQTLTDERCDTKQLVCMHTPGCQVTACQPAPNPCKEP